MVVTAPAANPPTHSDLDQLQGVWHSIAGPREARFLIVGNRFTFEFVGGHVYVGTFELSAGPMDMRIDAGPSDHVNQTSLCIHQIDGGVLRWCPGRPGSGRRLSAFPSVDDHRYLSLIFQRARRKAAPAQSNVTAHSIV